MGYEIKMIIGRCGEESIPEYEIDMEKPYSYGAGYKFLKDASGNRVATGRSLRWLQIYAEIDLCKLDYQDDPMNRLIRESHKKTDAPVCYFYGTDGNTQITEDRYELTMLPVPIGKVIKAMKSSRKLKGYRRVKWALALLEAMAGGPEEISVIFYGH